MDIASFAKSAEVIAHEIIYAYGMAPEDYYPVEEEVLSVYVFGAVNAYSQTLKLDEISELMFHVAMISVFSHQFGYDEKKTERAYQFCVKCTDKSYNPVLYTVFHRGIDAFFLLQQPEKLEADIKSIMSPIFKSMGIDEES